MKNKFLRILVLVMLLALVVGTVPAMAASKKVKINAETLWADAYGFQISAENVPENAKVTSVKSSNKSVLKVKKYGDTFSDIIVFPGTKTGKAKITVKYKVGKNSYSVTSPNYTVKKFPNAIKSLKIKIGNSTKTVNLKKNKIDYIVNKFNETKATVTVKAASDWRVGSLHLYSGSTDKDIKSGKSFKVPKGENGEISIALQNKKSGAWFLYHIGLYR